MSSRIATLGIDAVNLKATAGTKYTSGVLNVRHAFAFTAVFDATNVGGGSNGDAKLTIQVLDDDESTVIYEQDIVTGLDSKTTNQTVVTFGYGITTAIKGTGSLVAAANDVIKIAKFIKVVLEVTTANDGTTSTGTVQLLAEDL